MPPRGGGGGVGAEVVVMRAVAPCGRPTRRAREALAVAGGVFHEEESDAEREASGVCDEGLPRGDGCDQPQARGAGSHAGEHERDDVGDRAEAPRPAGLEEIGAADRSRGVGRETHPAA